MLASLYKVQAVGSNTQITPRLRVEVLEDVTCMSEVWQLRSARFRKDGASDRDQWDARCRHVLIRAQESGALAGYFRMSLIDGPNALAQSYAAQRYDLGSLANSTKPMIEVGRFCINPESRRNPDVLRLVWAEITRTVDQHGVGLLFGCASFSGTDPAAHAAAFAQLRAYRPPSRWRIGKGAGHTVPLEVAAGRAVPSATALPPLLRSYLAMGGWVSDHLVVDDDLGTLHVFAGLEVRGVPDARAQALRRLVG